MIGGVVGTVARYALSHVMYQTFGNEFAYGTLAVNLIGCFLIGFLSVLANDKMILNPEARFLLMIGFCGAFTTFSTFMLETANFASEGQALRALANVLVSVIVGFVVFQVGARIAQWF
jgi:CrcB protein